MSRFKAGDLVVVEIYGVDRDADTHRPVYTSRVPDGLMDMQKTDEMAEPLTDYTKPLTDKIERQARSINSLLHKIAELKTENAELKEKLHEEHYESVWHEGYSQGVSDEAEKWNENVKIIRDSAFEAGQVKGQNDAWELAQKIVRAGVDGGFSNIEMLQIFDSSSRYQVLKTHQYAEAAANVEVWEKEEIKVGDIYSHYGIGNFVICDIDREKDMVKTLWDDLSVGTEKLDEIKKQCTKTGRHIDVDAWLAQIGGGSDEAEN